MKLHLFGYITLLSLLVSCQKKEPPAPPVFQVEVAPVSAEDVDLFKSYVGHVQASVQVNVKAQVEALLVGYYFTEGEEVKQGDLIFKLDSRTFEANLAQAEAALAKSLAQLHQAEEVVRRNADLAKQDYVSKLTYDQYLTNVVTLKAAAAENQAQIDLAKINITHCNIQAPMNAIAGILQVDVGNLIPNVGSTPLITLNQISPCYALFSIPQKDLPEVMRLNRIAPLKIRAILNNSTRDVYDGHLDVINNQVDDQTGSIALRGIFSNEDKMLWPGEFVDIQLFLETKKGACLVPTQAINLGNKGKYLFVVKEDMTSELRQIQVGQPIGNMTLVTQGVQPAELVVISGQINLSNGAKVSIKKEGA